MKKKFYATYEELQDAVLLANVFGDWAGPGNHKQFRAENGVVLNWWKSTGTINFQGNTDVSPRLWRKLTAPNSHMGKKFRTTGK